MPQKNAKFLPKFGRIVTCCRAEHSAEFFGRTLAFSERRSISDAHARKLPPKERSHWSYAMEMGNFNQNGLNIINMQNSSK